MRPIQLEFQAFGPYSGYEKVDFSDLSAKGLFLICGQTGSGKTVILHAMTFALYGEGSGEGRKDFASLRCTNAAFDTSTFVKFIFENAGIKYLFERRLDRKRTNLSESYNLARLDENEVWQPLFENPKSSDLRAKAEELIGLKCDQFRQVVVLPQGKFETFLTAPSSEKESILSSIFGEDKWDEIAERLYKNCEERNNVLKAKRERINNSLAEEGCSSIAELKEKLLAKETTLAESEKEYEQAQYDERIANLQELLTLSKRFDDLHKAESRSAEYESRKDRRNQLEEDLKNAKKAEPVQEAIIESERAGDALDQRNKQLKAAEDLLQKTIDNVSSATKKLKDHLSKKTEIDKLREKKGIYEIKKSSYEEIGQDEDNCRELGASLEKATNEAENARKLVESLLAKTQILETEYTKLSNEYNEMLHLYLAGITGELAENLEEGKPCPVCGSPNHPNKAIRTLESVSKETLEAKQGEVENKNTQIKSLAEDFEKAKKNLDEKNKAVAEITAEHTKAQGILEEKRSNLIEGINSLKDLNKKIEEFEKTIGQYELLQNQLETEEKEETEKKTIAMANIENAKKECESSKQAYDSALLTLDKTLVNNGFASADEVKEYLRSEDEIDRMVTEVSEYDANVNANKEIITSITEELKGKEEPDKEKIAEELSRIDEAKKAYISENAKLEGEIHRIKSKSQELDRESVGFEEEITEAESDLAFARKLRGDTGTGLKRYVLGIMFSSVVIAANKMLENVHGGRYKLFRSDEVAKGSRDRKKGLELKVYDKYSDDADGRFVNTLSGGEKFLVSLALSIGMSTVAQRSGIRIEALFIDEGFGSLDENSIVDAMSVLNSIQEANGMVGIISHVQLLQERIPTKLIVTKNKGNSSINKSIG